MSNIYAIEIKGSEVIKNLPSNYHTEVKNDKCPTFIIKGNIKKPIQIKNDGTLPIRIVVEENSKASIIEVVELTNKTMITTEISKNSTIEHIVLEANNSANVSEIVRNTTVEENSVYNFYYATIADTNLNYTHDVRLIGLEATCNIKQISLSTKKQLVKYNNKIIHLAPHTAGNIECVGASFDDSHITFNTTGKIAKGYHSSSARQLNKGIMIGTKSQIEANPFLLIDEYDVTASHGATIGRMNDEELYYLMSRGLTKQESYLLLIEGYFASTINKIENEEIKELFNKKLEMKLA